MTHVPEDLVFPRTISIDLLSGRNDPVELQSLDTYETRRFEVTIYSTLRGDRADLVELIYSKLHGTGDLLNISRKVVTVIGKLMYDNFEVIDRKPIRVNDRTVYSSAIRFDVWAIEER
jgi:hypothetical protein